MITLIFKKNRAVGYATLDYSSTDPGEVICRMEEKELQQLTGENWRQKYTGLQIEGLQKTDKQDNELKQEHARKISREKVHLTFAPNLFEGEEANESPN